MAAGIDVELDKGAFVGKPAWWMAGELERVGKVFETCMTADQAMQQTMPWMVGLQNLFVEDGHGGFMQLPDRFRTTTREDLPRDDTRRYFGAVGADYVPIQNSEPFAIIDAIIGESGAHYETCGSLWGGRQIWVLAKNPFQTDVHGSKLDQYFLAATAHDGTRALILCFTPVHVVCANTLAMALNQKQSGTFKIRHTGNAIGKVDEAKKVLLKSKEYFNEHTDRMRAWAERRVSDSFVKAYLETLFPGDATRANNRRERIQDLFRGAQPGANTEALRGTAFGVFNAVTHYIQHDATTGRSMLDDGGKRNMAEARMDRVSFGGGARQREQAGALMETALEAEKALASVTASVSN